MAKTNEEAAIDYLKHLQAVEELQESRAQLERNYQAALTEHDNKIDGARGHLKHAEAVLSKLVNAKTPVKVFVNGAKPGVLVRYIEPAHEDLSPRVTVEIVPVVRT